MAFCGCNSLTTINIPDSIKTIGENAFLCKNLFRFTGKYASSDSRCIIINNEIVAFAEFGITEYTIPNNVTTIGKVAFSGCSNLTTVNIPDSVKTIEHQAFAGCLNLTTINIPNSVKTIKACAFRILGIQLLQKPYKNILQTY